VKSVGKRSAATTQPPLVKLPIYVTALPDRRLAFEHAMSLFQNLHPPVGKRHGIHNRYDLETKAGFRTMLW